MAYDLVYHMVTNPRFAKAIPPLFTRSIDDSDHRIFDFLCYRLKLGLTEKSEDRCWLECGNLHFAALLVDRDPAGESIGDRHIRFKDTLGLFWIAHFDNTAFGTKLDSLGRPTSGIRS